MEQEAAVQSEAEAEGEMEIAEAVGPAADPANAGIRREPDLPEHEEVVARPNAPQSEFEFEEVSNSVEEIARRRLQDRVTGVARQASLDPGDGIAL